MCYRKLDSKRTKYRQIKYKNAIRKNVKIGKKRGFRDSIKKVTFLEEAQVPFRCSRCSGSIEITFPQGAEKSSKISRKSMKNGEQKGVYKYVGKCGAKGEEKLLKWEPKGLPNASKNRQNFRKSGIPCTMNSKKG